MKTKSRRKSANQWSLDKSVNRTFDWLGSKAVLIDRTQVRTWQGTVAIAFVAGFFSMLIWSVSDNIGNKTGAMVIQPPIVSITAPVANSIVNGTVSVTANASSLSYGIAFVDFYLNSSYKFRDNTPPYSWSWITISLADGSYALKAIAYDQAGNTQISSPVSVTVKNSAIDTTAPVISSVIANPVRNKNSFNAVISWNTSEPATSQVSYGPTTSYGATTTLDSTMTLSHKQTITGLAQGTTYHYKVVSSDQSGNRSSSGDMIFITLKK